MNTRSLNPITLLPCPFCGSAPLFYDHTGKPADESMSAGSLGCRNSACNFQPLITHATPPYLAEKWNVRATDQPVDSYKLGDLRVDSFNGEVMQIVHLPSGKTFSATKRESGEDKLHELLLRFARAIDCATIVSCGSENDKMFMLNIVEQVRDNIVRHSGIKESAEIWLAKEFPDRYQLTQIEDQEVK